MNKSCPYCCYLCRRFSSRRTSNIVLYNEILAFSSKFHSVCSWVFIHGKPCLFFVLNWHPSGNKPLPERMIYKQYMQHPVVVLGFNKLLMYFSMPVVIIIMSFQHCKVNRPHYNDVVMGAMASQITSLTIFLLNRLFRCRSKETSKFHVTGLCAGNSPVTGEFPAQRTRKMFSFDDVIMRYGLTA